MLSYGGLRTGPFTKVLCLGMASVHWPLSYAPSGKPALADGVDVRSIFLALFSFLLSLERNADVRKVRKVRKLLGNKMFLAPVLWRHGGFSNKPVAPLKILFPRCWDRGLETHDMSWFSPMPVCTFTFISFSLRGQRWDETNYFLFVILILG